VSKLEQGQIEAQEKLRVLWHGIDTAAEPTKEELEADAKMAWYKVKEDNEKAFIEHGLKGEHITCTWELWRKGVPEHVEKIERTIKRHRTDAGKAWLFLSGETGCGKTMTMALLAKGWILFGKRVIWTSARELNRLVNEFKKGEQNKIDLITCDYLFIDEIGRDNMDCYPILFEIVKERAADRKRTCMASNLSKEEFLSTCDSAFIRRMEDNTLFVNFKTKEGL
jgi:DNA replication protein DnaC